MKSYQVIDNHVHFRQEFPRDVLRGLFVTIFALEIPLYDTGSKLWPYMVKISESEFLYVIELAKGA